MSRSPLLRRLALAAAAVSLPSAAAALSPLPGGRPALPTISVVAVDLLWTYLGQTPRNTSQANDAMSAACGRGFTLLRVAATAFWPRDMRSTYVADPARYWAAFDALVAAARARGCLLMPVVTWSDWIWPDLAGEPAGWMFSRADSAARAAFVRYASELATRYAREPAIAAWEISNEQNLKADIDMNGTTYGCAAGKGTPAHRTSADNRTTDGVIELGAAVAAALRAADVLARPISSGHALARPAAQHLRARAGDWTPDSLADFAANFADIHSYADLASVHIYAGDDNVRWNLTHDPNTADILRIVKQVADGAGKNLYVGEFGDAKPGPRPFTASVLDNVRRANVSLATAWVWEFYQFGDTPSDFSLVPGRDDAAIAMLQAGNKASDEERSAVDGAALRAR